MDGEAHGWPEGWELQLHNHTTGAGLSLVLLIPKEVILKLSPAYFPCVIVWLSVKNLRKLKK